MSISDLMTLERADQLLSAGLLSPERHQQISSQLAPKVAADLVPQPEPIAAIATDAPMVGPQRLDLPGREEDSLRNPQPGAELLAFRDSSMKNLPEMPYTGSEAVQDAKIRSGQAPLPPHLTPQHLQSQIDAELKKNALPDTKAQTPTSTTGDAPPPFTPTPSGGGGGGQIGLLRKHYDNLDNVNQNQLASMDGVRDAVERKALEQGRFHGEEAKIYQDAADNAQRVERERAEAMKLATESYRAEMDRQMQAIKDIKDPENYWASKSIAQNIGMAVALAGSAFGSAITKGPDVVGNMLRTDIERHADMQKLKFKNEFEKIAKQTEFSDKKWAQAQYLDRRKDEEIAKGYELAKRQILQKAAESNSRQAGENAALEVAKIDEIIFGLQEKGIKQRFEGALKINAASAQGSGNPMARYQAMWEKMTPEQRQSYSSREAFLREVVGGQVNKGGDVNDPVARVPKDQRNEASKEQAGHAAIQAGIKSVGEMFDTWEKTTVGWDYRERGSLQAGIGARAKEASGKGNNSDKDFAKLIEPFLPQTGDTKKILDFKRENLTNLMKSQHSTPTLDRYNTPAWREEGVKLPGAGKERK